MSAPHMLFYGIDPGVSGGIAVLNERGDLVFAGKMPETDRDIYDCLETAGGVLADVRPVHCIIERVNPGVFGRPGAKMGVVSAFTFGGGYRALKMALTALRIPFDEVLPVKWQTMMSCRSRGDKNITKARAQQLFPGVRVTHATADALLIAEFNRRINRGEQGTPAPPQKGLFDGEEKRATARQREEEGAEGAAQAATEGAARHGRPGHRGDRARRTRLR